MTGLSWVDALYYAAVTLSTTGYGDITPVCESARLANVLIITPLRFLFLIVLVGTTIEVLTQRTREQVRSNRWRSNVNDHTVIIGYGVKGRAAARSLVDAGTSPSQIVVVATDRGTIDEATRDGLRRRRRRRPTRGRAAGRRHRTGAAASSSRPTRTTRRSSSR